MKITQKILLILVALLPIQVMAQTVTKELKVAGNCSMCKARIEEAADVKGVKSANWDQETNVLTVVFNEKKVTLGELSLNIAEVGHDTELNHASDEAYEKLHSCCSYKRMDVPVNKEQPVE
jgi:copper chaperone CopZ